MGSVGNMESVNSPNLEHGRNPTFDLPDRNWERLRRSPLYARSASLGLSGRAVAAAGRVGQFIALGQVLLPAG